MCLMCLVLCVNFFACVAFVKEVAEEDLLKDVEDGDADDMAEGLLVIPRTCEQSATVPNCCIICLSAYKKGDVVVWSSNEECQHAFHRKCIVKYLVKIQKKVASTPCPCCRRRFTDLEVEMKRRKKRKHFFGTDPRRGRYPSLPTMTTTTTP